MPYNQTPPPGYGYGAGSDREMGPTAPELPAQANPAAVNALATRFAGGPDQGTGFGTNDPRGAITEALMNVQYPPPSLAGPPQSRGYGMPQGQGPQGPQMPPMPQFSQAPLGGMGPGMPPAAQPAGFNVMQTQGPVAGAPQPPGARGINY